MLPLFAQITGGNTIPDSWRGSIIYPIYKKGNKNSANSFRLVALINIEVKYYAGLLLEDLIAWTDEKSIVPINQTGFCKGMGTTANILALSLLVDGAKLAKHPLFMCFIDYSSAFDKIDRSKLWHNLKDKK